MQTSTNSFETDEVSMLPYKLTKDGVVSKEGINTGNFNYWNTKNLLKNKFLFHFWKCMQIILRNAGIFIEKLDNSKE